MASLADRAQVEAAARIVTVMGYSLSPGIVDLDVQAAVLYRLADTFTSSPRGARNLITLYASTWAMMETHRSKRLIYNELSPIEQLAYLDNRRARLIQVLRDNYKTITYPNLRQAMRAAVRGYFPRWSELRRDVVDRVFEEL